MNRIIYHIIVVLSFAVSMSFSTQAGDVTCGGNERWSVKILTDVDAKKINFKADTVTIDFLSKQMPGKKIGNKTPRFGIEFKTYVVKCGVREYRSEEDGDYHLVLFDLNDSTKTMIAEIPMPFCASESKHVQKFTKAYDYFEQKMKSKKNKVKPGVYMIYGVAFYDKKHGQLGLAPNGIEIHPVLSIKKAS